MKLVVGLGNPGRKYENTRHNVGYRVAAELARRHGDGRPRTAFGGEVVDVDVGGIRAVVLCPHTYMNRSGSSVAKAVGFYKLELEDLLVVSDDMNLPLGKLRFRPQGSAGGQKGLDDIIRCLGSNEFSRLRIGIDQPPAGRDGAGYVLGRFAKNELEAIEHAVVVAADAVVDWARDGVAECMNRYN